MNWLWLGPYRDAIIAAFNTDVNQTMIFTELAFWVFFGAVLTVFSFLHKRQAARNAFLFIASLWFYYKTSGAFFSILLFSTFSDYLIGFRIDKAEGSRRKWWLTLSVVINLFVLVYFKYAYFFTDAFNQIFGTDFTPVNYFALWANDLFGSGFRVDKILLPVGISFYTFQTISYAVDVYRGHVKPVKNILDFGFYVSFFPQLVAGPIVRAADFIPQLYQKYHLTKKEFGIAAFWILNGLLKKMFLADYLAVNFIDRVFEDPTRFTGFENLMALYGYSLQVYADFSGYTDIAIGVALLMGFRLPKNFDSPYKADSCGNFWKRWHISLSSWLKDYLYIPLGGNRGGTIGTYVVLFSIVFMIAAMAGNFWILVGFGGFALVVLGIARAVPTFKLWLTTNINVMLTMAIGGLWHGASWNFAIWGGLNGLGIVTYKLWRKISPWENKSKWWNRAWAIFITFNFISFTRIWFRTGSKNTWENLGEQHNIIEELFTANGMLNQILFKFDAHIAGQFFWEFRYVMGAMLLGYLIHWLPSKWKDTYRNWYSNAPIALQIVGGVAVIFCVYQFLVSENQPFIYFQF